MTRSAAYLWRRLLFGSELHTYIIQLAFSRNLTPNILPTGILFSLHKSKQQFRAMRFSHFIKYSIFPRTAYFNTARLADVRLKEIVS